MKRFILLIAIALTMTGCAVYPGYYGYYDSGYYDSGYYGYPYGYVGTSVNLNFHGGNHGHYGWYGHGWQGHRWHR